MKAMVVGCGRVGAHLADRLASAGHDVVIIDQSTQAFARLPSTFPGRAIRGDGTDEAVLRRAGLEEVDVFFALTEGDNRNVLMAQLASETLGIAKVVAKINDPVRAEAYATLGLATICRTVILSDALAEYVGLPALGARGVVAPLGSHHPDPEAQKEEN